MIYLTTSLTIISYLWMIGPHDQPATEQKGKVEDARTHNKTDDIRKGFL